MLSSFANLPEKFKLFAAEQYAIGWRGFTEGQISMALINAQRERLNAAGGRMNIKQWTKGFTTGLLHITQSQWIHHNSSLHQREHGYLDQQLKKKLAKDVVRYLDTDPREVPEESRYLLEIDPDEIMDSTTYCQSYWLLAMKAARRVGRRAEGKGLRQGMGRRLNESRKAWNKKMWDQLTLNTRDTERAAEEWGKEVMPKTTKRR